MLADLRPAAPEFAPTPSALPSVFAVHHGSARRRPLVGSGYCQPGQIMAAVALVRRVAEEGRDVTEDDLDGIRNICRCGTYPRIREAIRSTAGRM
nr:2Fe-2S iron-sulfur cluster-binding protein [Actinospica acidiphila]